MGGRLAKIEVAFNSKLEHLKEAFGKDILTTTSVGKDIFSEAAHRAVEEHPVEHQNIACAGLNQSKAATTPSGQGAASSRSSKTCKRKERRTRAKLKHEYSRKELLALKTVGSHGTPPVSADLHPSPVLESSREASGADFDIGTRIYNLESVVLALGQKIPAFTPVAQTGTTGSVLSTVDWGPFQCARPAGELSASHCWEPNWYQQDNVVDQPWCAYNAWEVLASELNPDACEFMPEDLSVRAGSAAQPLAKWQERIFDDLFATLRDSTFVPTLLNVLLGDGDGIKHHCLSLERQLAFQRRPDASIKDSLRGHFGDKKESQPDDPDRIPGRKALEHDDGNMVALHALSGGIQFQVPKLAFLSKADISVFTVVSKPVLRQAEWYALQVQSWSQTGMWPVYEELGSEYVETER